MYMRSPKYIAILIVPAIAVIAACGNQAPASPTAPAAIKSALLTADPMTVKPESLPLSFCPAGPPFGFRLVLTVGNGRDSFLLRRLLFNFTDLRGGFSVPAVTPISTSRIGSIPDSMPIPLPTRRRFHAELVADPHSRFLDAPGPADRGRGVADAGGVRAVGVRRAAGRDACRHRRRDGFERGDSQGKHSRSRQRLIHRAAAGFAPAVGAAPDFAPRGRGRSLRSR